MGLNRELLGKSYPETRFSATREKMVAYAQATNEDNPLLVGAEANMASPMFGVAFLLENMIQGLFDSDLLQDANIGRMVHGSQDMRFLHPVRPGDELRSVTTLDSIEQKGSGELLSLAYRTRNQSDQVVLEASSGFFFRGPPDPEVSKKSPQLTQVPDEPAFRVLIPVHMDQPARYAEASGDRNPIHIDEDSAKMMGFPGVIVHGLCTMALAQKALLDQAGGSDPERLSLLAVRFSKVVFPGDGLELVAWKADPAMEKTSITFVVRNQKGDEVMRAGRAEFS